MRILIIRRDNIGDLVCTTPLITGLRRKYPQAWIGALVNSYNAPVLERNPDLDEIVVYTKLKHVEGGQSAFAALRARLASLWKLRRMRLDHVVLATSDFVPRTARLARWLGPAQVVGFSDGSTRARKLDRSVPTSEVAGRHEVERVFALAKLFDIEGSIPPLTVVPDPKELANARAAFGTERPLVAVHISARRPAQRWPAQRFASLIDGLSAQSRIVLLWSPGAAGHATHPGDDDKAKEITGMVANQKRLIPYPTERLQQLIGALAACDAVICSDGGASHLAAALGKPMVCFFGDADAGRWRPWGIPLRLLQPASRRVADLSPEEVLTATASLFAEGVLRHPAP